MSENDTAIIGLKELIKERFDQSEKQRDYRFEQIEKQLKEMQSSLTSRLDKIDADIRGKGKVGINVQLDRLENSTNQLKKANEQSEKSQRKWLKLFGGAILLIAVGAADNRFSLIEKLIGK